ncbi:hypothetical protein [Agrococcus jejuensis]|uniref:Uncharacterized protein n=1 Tax=Agrococcus jejuensis TaxID=399736 RepID=A0A1G8BSP2_9MICO|nr:hypothetical protein [Agrococcus jejuensis]SDH36182.1 hypothetical protein SAMN04489720_1042 [Agrococcus jejuensis]
MSDTMSVRELLLGKPGSRIPPFRILLAPCWDGLRPDDDGVGALRDAASARLAAAHRPDLDASVGAMLAQARARLRRTSTFLVLHQVQDFDGFFAPMTISFTEHAAASGSLDEQVSAIVAKHGAEPLRGDVGMLRWTTDASTAVGEGRVRTRTISYLTPVPGTERTRALLAVATILVADDAPDDHPLLVGSEQVADAMLATFEWDVAA